MQHLEWNMNIYEKVVVGKVDYSHRANLGICLYGKVHISAGPIENFGYVIHWLVLPIVLCFSNIEW